MTAVSVTDAPPLREKRALPPLALVPLAALAWWIVGFLPWLLGGATDDAAREIRVSTVALPLFAGNLSALVLGAGVGGLAAGLTARLGAGRRIAGAGACSVGVAIALTIALVQSRNGISGDINDGRVTDGLSVVVVLMTLVGLGLGLLCLTGRVGFGFTLAAVAGAAPAWLMGVLAALGVSSTGAIQNADEVTRWVGAAALVAALVVVGLRPPLSAVAWPGIVLLAWLISPTMTAAGYAEVFLRPGMGGAWGDHFSATMDVWRLASSTDMRPLTPWVVAVAVAVAVSLWLAARSHPPVVEHSPPSPEGA